MSLLNSACVIAIAWSAATAACAADFEVPIELSTGAVINLVIVKHGETEKSGRTTKVDLTLRYRQELVETDDGYSITQTLTGSEVPPEMRGAMDSVLAISRKITYATGPDLAPVRIVSLDELVAAMTKAAIDLEGPTPSQEVKDRLGASARQMFAAMSPESAANSILKEQALVAAPQMISLDRGKAADGEVDSPNPFGGAPIKRRVTFELKSIDKAAGIAVIEALDELDPDSLKALIPTLIEKLGPNTPRPTAAEIAAIKIEQKTACRYEMNLKTGLTSKADCTLSRSGIGEDGKPERRTERMIMTQTLVKR